jgi:autotransporter-associated beta strand protein
MNIPKKIKIISAILLMLGLSLGTSLAAGPAGVTDAVLWLDAAQLIGLNNGDTVSSWTDMSGNNNHATLSKGAPKYQTNVLNGQPIMRFTTADMFATANLSAQFPSAATLFIVATINSTSYDFLYTGSAWNEWWRYGGSGNSYPAIFRNPRINDYCTMPGTGTRLFTVSSSASAWRMSIDGVSKGVVSGSYSAGGVQNIPGNANEASPCACDIAEVIEFNRVLTSAEEAAVNSYIANKYGLAIAIDAQHAPGDMYWDNNGSTAGFGTAAGTWGAPTTGNSSQGWSGDPTGSTLPVDFTTAVTNTLRFGSAEAGLAAGTITVSGNVTASNLTFSTGSGAITLAGGTITLPDTSSITVYNNATISSVLAGAATRLTKQGSGYLTLSGGNTMTGDVTVRQGALAIASGVLRTTVSVIVEDGAKLEIGAWANSIANPISLSGHGPGAAGALIGWALQTCTGPITLLADSTIQKSWHHFSLNNTITGTDKNLILLTTDGTGSLNVNGAISLGSGALSITGIAWTYLNASNNFSGGTTVGTSSGGLTLNHVNALGTGCLTVNSGVVDLNTRSVSIASLSGTGGSITDNGAAGTTTLTVNQSTNTTYSGVINNGASRVIAFTKTGSGTLTLAGNNSYSGATTVSAGGLLGVTGGSCLNSSVTVADGATNGVRVASFNGQWVCSNLTYSAGTTTLNIDFGGSQPSATIAPLRVAGDLDMGTVGISVANGVWPTTPGTYPLISYAGTLTGTVPGTALVLPSGLTATIVNNTGSKRIDLNVTAVTWTPSSFHTWTNLVSGNASGSWGNAANWSNNIPDGVDTVADFSTLDITTEGFVNIDAPRTVGRLRFGDTTPNNNWTLTNAALTLATTVVQPVIDVSNPNASINNVLKGTQGFIKQGSGTLYINGISTMKGDVTVRQGTLFIANGVLDTTVSVSVEDGARMEISGWASTIANPLFLSGKGTGGKGALHGQGNQTYSGPITLLTDSRISHDWNNFWLTGPISGTDKNLELWNDNWLQPGIAVNGSMNLGSGALTINTTNPDGNASYLGAANTYSGGTVLTNYAMLGIGNVGALGSGGVTLYKNNPNSRLNLNTFSVTVGWLSGPGGIISDWNSGAGTTTFTVNQSINTTYSGVISNGATRVLALVKSGSGLLTLSATNTYTGATAISNGTLAVNGALSSSAVTVCTGAAFAAGTTGVVGRATLGGTLTFENSSALLVDVAAVAADAVEVTGNVVIGTGVEVRLSGDQEKSGSWELIKTTTGTVTGDPVLVNGLHGATLSRTDTAIVLTIPPMGTMVRVL